MKTRQSFIKTLGAGTAFGGMEIALVNAAVSKVLHRTDFLFL